MLRTKLAPLPRSASFPAPPFCADQQMTGSNHPVESLPLLHVWKNEMPLRVGKVSAVPGNQKVASMLQTDARARTDPVPPSPATASTGEQTLSSYRRLNLKQRSRRPAISDDYRATSRFLCSSVSR